MEKINSSPLMTQYVANQRLLKSDPLCLIDVDAIVITPSSEKISDGNPISLKKGLEKTYAWIYDQIEEAVPFERCYNSSK